MHPKQVWPLAVSLSLIITGLLFICVSPPILKYIISTNLILTPDSHVYDLWKHFPTLVPTDFYIFNWTNPEDIYNKSVKPNFEELGPYRFMVDLGKTNITWNDNGTVSFKPLKYWFYVEDENNGDLQDKITNANPVALASAYVARTWTYMVRRGLSLSLSGIAPTINMTHTVDELLFSGYPDTLITLARTFPFFVGTEMPKWDRFGWFYKRNGTSSDHEGFYNMGTGKNSIFGKIYNWNYKNKSSYFEGTCADIDSSTGENFDPDTLGDVIKIFSPEMCRAVVLQYSEDVQVNGIIGRKYMMGDYMLDNGTKYPETKCSCSGTCFPYGVFNVSSCRFGAPAFGSLPHFYKSDPYYKNLITGLKPEERMHDFYVVVEPNTGVPLKVRANLQLNLRLTAIPGVSMYEDVPTAFLPIMWVDQRIDIPESENAALSQMLNILFVTKSIGILLIIVGVALILYFVIVRSQECHYKKKHVKSAHARTVILHAPEEKRLL